LVEHSTLSFPALTTIFARSNSTPYKDMTSEISSDEIRRRLPQEASRPKQAPSTEIAKDTVQQLNASAEEDEKDAKERKTYGRTPGGVGP